MDVAGDHLAPIIELMLDASLSTAELTKQIRTAAEGHVYTLHHAPRYAILLQEAAPYVVPGGTRILDIGLSRFTQILRETFACPVDSLGYGREVEDAESRHHFFDLNRTQHRSEWRSDLPKYNIIIFAEVIEHLHTSPHHVLSFLSSLLAPGGVIILQTPNALALGKRIKPLLGMHPYEQIRLDDTDPGHFREYTAKELQAYAAGAGFDVVRLRKLSYFDLRHEHSGNPSRAFLKHAQYYVNLMLPPGLRPGITMVLRKRDHGG